ncbi:head maturation protease, ClpP-related [Streptomyces sp. NPDC004288]
MPPKTARPRAQLRQGRNDWYRIENLAGGTAAVYIYDEIGYWGVTASDFVAELSEMQNVTAIDLHINSPGGEVFDGLAIMNCLRSHPASVTTYVDGLAASIASVIAMAGDRIVMGPHSQLMVHEGSGLCIGDAAEMRKMADLLDFQSDNIAGVYQARAGGTVEEWRAVMLAETWYTAEEAVTAGLADEVAQRPTTVTEPAAPASAAMGNTWDLSVFRYAGRDAAPPPRNAIEPATLPAVETSAPAEPDPLPDAEATSITEPEPAVEKPPAVVETEPAAVEETDVAPLDTEWAELSAHLATASPTGDDVFARLKEALL